MLVSGEGFPFGSNRILTRFGSAESGPTSVKRCFACSAASRGLFAPIRIEPPLRGGSAFASARRFFSPAVSSLPSRTKRMTSRSAWPPRCVTRSTLSVTDSGLPFLSSSSDRVAVVWLWFSRSFAMRASRSETFPRTVARSGGMPVARSRRRGRRIARYLGSGGYPRIPFRSIERDFLSHRFPAAGEPAREREEQGGRGGEEENLRPERRERLVAPEHLHEAVDRPRVQRDEADLLNAFRHQEAWIHASAERRHDEDHHVRERHELHARSRERGEHEAERGRGERRHDGHNEKSRNVAVELEPEEDLPPDEHHRQLRDGDGREVQELARQELPHRHARRENAVERAALDLLDQRPAGARRREEEEHDPETRGRDRDARALLLLSENVAHLDVHQSSARAAGSGTGVRLPPQLVDVPLERRLLLRSEVAAPAVHLIDPPLRHHVGQGGHRDLLQKPGEALRGDRIGRVGEDAQGRSARLRAEADRRLAEAFRHDERERDVAGAYHCLRRRGVGGRSPSSRLFRPPDDPESRLALQGLDEPLRVRGAVLVDDDERDPPGGRTGRRAAAEERREDGEEDDREDEREHERRAVALQLGEVSPGDREDHSRNSRPVSWRNTDSSVPVFRARSRIFTPSLRNASRRSAISRAGSVTEHWTVPSENVAPRLSSSSRSRAGKGLSVSIVSIRPAPRVRRTSSSFVPSASPRPLSVVAVRSQRRSASSM